MHFDGFMDVITEDCLIMEEETCCHLKGKLVMNLW